MRKLILSHPYQIQNKSKTNIKIVTPTDMVNQWNQDHIRLPYSTYITLMPEWSKNHMYAYYVYNTNNIKEDLDGEDKYYLDP